MKIDFKYVLKKTAIVLFLLSFTLCSLACLYLGSFFYDGAG